MESILGIMLECWLAGIIDFNGVIGIRLGANQLQPFIMIYSRKRENLILLREAFSDFSQPIFISKNLFMSQIVGIRSVMQIIKSTLPYLNILNDIASKVFEFCEIRVRHFNERYSIKELQLVREILALTSRPTLLSQRLEALEKWV